MTLANNVTVTQCPVVTIDGPSGAGKGTICRLLAQDCGFSLLDSGALYRLTALSCLSNGIDFADEDAVVAQAETLDMCFLAEDNGTLILLEGRDVSGDIRAENVGMGASQVAALPKVRQVLLQRQRDFATAPGLIADGRDMGTVVFPHAAVKVFLTASAWERAKRRVLQLQRAGQEANFDTILADIEARDYRDSHRASAPLKPADDALMLDSTDLTIEQVCQQIRVVMTAAGICATA